MNVRMRSVVVGVAVVASSLSFACGDDAEVVEEEELPDVDCPDTPPDYADVEAFQTVCVSSVCGGYGARRQSCDYDRARPSAGNLPARCRS